MTGLTANRFGFLEVYGDCGEVDSAVKVFQPALKPVQFCLDPVDLLLDSYYIFNFDRLFNDLIILGKLVLIVAFLCLEIDIFLCHILPLCRGRFDCTDCLDAREGIFKFCCRNPDYDGTRETIIVVFLDICGGYIAPLQGCKVFESLYRSGYIFNFNSQESSFDDLRLDPG